MVNIASLKASNEILWRKVKITPARQAEVDLVAKRLCAPMAKARYEEIAKTTGVPWFVVAVIHEREASQNFTRQLGQGDPLDEVSTHTPRGMGPYFNHASDLPLQDAFYRCAVDVLRNSAPFAARWKDWTAGGTLTLLDEYNGLAYEMYHHEPSPYLWGATNDEELGKYVADGKFSASTWDQQIGCAALLMGMMALDPTVRFATVPGT
jgi:lysozyme family protein